MDDRSQCEVESRSTRERCRCNATWERDVCGYRLKVCGIHQFSHNPRPWIGFLIRHARVVPE